MQHDLPKPAGLCRVAKTSRICLQYDLIGDMIDAVKIIASGVCHMWTRAELKQNAKAVLRHSYWESLAAYLIAALIGGAAAGLIALIPVVNVFGSVAATIFLTLPLNVGLYFFFLRARTAPPEMKNLFYSFNEARYMPVVGAMAWQYLFIFLWSLIPASGVVIFIVNVVIASFGGFALDWSQFVFTSSMVVVAVLCGVIYLAGTVIVVMKSIAYSMVPFILTDNPNIGYARALRLSIDMTHGQKWDIFVLMLSFAGWALLGTLLLFIGVIFLLPYTLATYSQLYLRLRDNAIRSGLCTPQELNLPVY